MKKCYFWFAWIFSFWETRKMDELKRFDYKNGSECILATRNSTFEYSDTLNDFLEKGKEN